MAKKLNFSILLMALVLSACSSLKKDGKSNAATGLLSSEPSKGKESPEEKEKRVVEAFKVLNERMSKMVEAAKKEGPEAVTFLASDLFLKANDASMRGDSHTSAYLYKHLVSLKSKDNFIRKKYAIELIRLGSLVEAKIVLEDLLKETKFEEETVGLILGGVHTALSENEDARKVYQNVLKRHPSSEEACIFLAKSYGLSDKYKKAHSLLNKCNRGKSERAIFHYYQGKIYLKQELRTKAMTSFKKALKVEPSYYQAAMAIGLMMEEKKELKSAVKVYRTFVDGNPDSFPVLSRLVQVLFATEQFKAVIPYAEALSSLDPSDLNLRVRLGILYTDNKEFKQAIGVFKEILAAVPSSDKVLYYLGSLYQQTSRYELALDSFSKITEDSSLYVDSSLQIAQILQTLVHASDDKWSGRYKEYLSDRGAKVKDLKVEFQMMLATYYEGKLEYKSAISSIEAVRNINDYTEGHDYYLASLYEKVEDFQRARGIVQEILDKNPKNAHALNFLGYSMLENDENIEEAFSLIKQAVELKPNDGYIRDSLGWFYYKTGQLQKALIEVKKAHELVKTDVVIAKHLAIIYRDLKKFKKAKRFFAEALRNCKFESERKEVMEALGGLQDTRLPASN